MGLVWFNFGHKGWCFGLLRVLLGLYESLMKFYSSLSELGFDVGIQPPTKILNQTTIFTTFFHIILVIQPSSVILFSFFERKKML